MPHRKACATMQCFVCQEPTDTKSNCLCAASVHDECLVKSANISNKYTCSICKHTINNLYTVRRWNLTEAQSMLRIVFAGFTAVLSLLSLLCLAAAADANDFHVFALLMLCSVGCLVLAILNSRAMIMLVHDPREPCRREFVLL